MRGGEANGKFAREGGRHSPIRDVSETRYYTSNLTRASLYGIVREGEVKTDRRKEKLVNYDDLTALLAPEQFAQLQTVRAHLLQDPTVMDKQREPAQTQATGEADGT